jgi:hypothetical protein
MNDLLLFFAFLAVSFLISECIGKVFHPARLRTRITILMIILLAVFLLVNRLVFQSSVLGKDSIITISFLTFLLYYIVRGLKQKKGN